MYHKSLTSNVVLFVLMGTCRRCRGVWKALQKSVCVPGVPLRLQASEMAPEDVEPARVLLQTLHSIDSLALLPCHFLATDLTRGRAEVLGA